MTLIEVLTGVDKSPVARAIKINYERGKKLVFPVSYDGEISFTDYYPSYLAGHILAMDKPEEFEKIVELVTDSIKKGWQYE